jgi:integrase
MSTIKNQKLTLTDAIIRAATLPEKGDYFLRDNKVDGLAVRVYASGRKSWIAEKKQDGKPLRIVLGFWGTEGMTLPAARVAAKQRLAEMAQGINPNLEKKKRIRQNKIEIELEAMTIQVICEKYVKDKIKNPDKPALTTIKSWENSFDKLSKGTLWKMPVVNVLGEDLAEEYDRLANSVKAKTASNNGKTQAAITMRSLRAAFNVAVTSRKIQDTNLPFQQFNKLRKGWNLPTKRDRIVGKHEGDMAKWWAAVHELRNRQGSNRRDAPMIADFLVLGLLWGGRKNEVLSLTWENVDFEHGVVRFVKTKNKLTHEFPMAAYARGILENRKKVCEESYPESPWVFPSSRTGRETKLRGHISEPKKTIAQVAKTSGCLFSTHDLRRTFGTLLNEMGVSGYTIRKALNHAATDTAERHYLQQRLQSIRLTYQNLEDKILIEAGVKKPDDNGFVPVDMNTYQQLLAQQKELAALKAMLEAQAGAAKTA